MFKHLFIACLAVAGLAGARPAAAQTYLVIVNEANPAQTISRDDLSQMFLKRATRWDSGDPVVPVDLVESSPVRESFSQAVLGRPVSAIVAFWQREIFSGHGVPPVQKSSENEVIDYVRANPNAVGYVRNGSPLGSGVRALRILN